MTPVERMLAEHQCERLIKRFAVLNDENAYDEMVGMFTESGQFARPSQPEDLLTGKAAILEAFKARPLRISRHFISNIMVDIVDQNSANAISYVLLYTAPTNSTESKPPYLIGRFKDQLERVDGQWLFRQRLGSVDLRAS